MARAAGEPSVVETRHHPCARTSAPHPQPPLEELPAQHRSHDRACQGKGEHFAVHRRYRSATAHEHSECHAADGPRAARQQTAQHRPALGDIKLARRYVTLFHSADMLANTRARCRGREGLPPKRSVLLATIGTTEYS